MPEEMELNPNQHKRLQELNQALDSGMFVHVRRMLHQMPACDVALLLESSPPAGRKVLWQLTDPEQHGEILEELNEDVMEGVLQLMAPETLAAATEGMDTDDIAYVLRSLPDSVYQEVLEQMDGQDRHRVEAALAYPEDTAGSIMNTDTITIRADVTIDVVLRYLRVRGELPEATDALYVVDEDDSLLGDIPLSTLLTVNPNVDVRDVMDSKAETIPVAMDEDDVAALFERHDWISAPVVDEEGHLLGRVTIDDVVDIIRENAEHSMMGMAGMDDDEDTFAPVIKSTQRRTFWLAINLCAALIAASISNMFESTLEQLATLAILMTIVPSMGGIAGNQTLALVIRGLAVGHIGEGNSRWLIGKEAAIGMLNGMIWATVIAIVVTFWKGDWTLGVIIAGAMFINMSLAGLAGVTIPLLMKKFNIDPALAGGMALTTITDVMGLFSFLGMATLILA
ncbi:magnesium transporter [Agarivorans sp. Toyoura001]|uniref:magnesium transporter n=1 Tax=unclassified Agarivorans TaxID=2636026 RepID=UPI0010D9FFC2|nr:magnesium transporter [Agarivorans sp. Toyoura001]GDY26494.1 magnesium transporter MgtE [Agarivorans sp. Toyoura001]